RIARNFPAAEVLAARGQTEFLAGVRAKAQDPIRQPPRIKQFARMGGAVSGLNVRVAGIFLIEAAEGGLEFLGVTRLEFHGGISMSVAAAAVAARAFVKVRLAGDPAKFERFGNVFLDGMLDFVQLLPGIEKPTRDGILQQGVAMLFKIRNLRALERLAAMLFVV